MLYFTYVISYHRFSNSTLQYSKLYCSVHDCEWHRINLERKLDSLGSWEMVMCVFVLLQRLVVPEDNQSPPKSLEKIKRRGRDNVFLLFGVTNQ